MTKIYHTCGKIIPIKLSTVQQQTNSVDCGVFALAYATEFCYSNFPAGKDLAFNVNEMRDHLVHCLTKQQLLPFPRQKNRKSLKLRINTSIIVNIEKYCSAKCDLPNLFDNMVSCSQCSCREKFNHYDYGEDNIKVVLYDDGMEVDSDSFHCIDPNTSIMILQGNEIWSPPLPPLNGIEMLPPEEKTQPTEKFPKLLTSLHQPDIAPNSEYINDTYQKYTVTDSQAYHLEEATRNQAVSPLWFEHRKGRVTASKAHDVLRMREQTAPDNHIRNERQPQDAMETEVLVDHYIPSRGLQIDHSNYVSGVLLFNFREIGNIPNTEDLEDVVDMIVEIINQDLVVQFTKDSGTKDYKVWPEIADISAVSRNQIWNVTKVAISLLYCQNIIPIKEFVGPKIYSITYDMTEKSENGDENKSEKEKKVAKGIVKCEKEKILRHTMFKTCFLEESITMNSTGSIRSKKLIKTYV
ncbi:unnamed protein product [Mytilus edulis]|uniref:CIDE-N domain-containing protein n=1 Tax=Mytilus edulis TaxID=6550 RepID=A0A8S3RSI6_MYTED|nr:unnamed protein product [Mytilus edulis]